MSVKFVKLNIKIRGFDLYFKTDSDDDMTLNYEKKNISKFFDELFSYHPVYKDYMILNEKNEED